MQTNVLFVNVDKFLIIFTDIVTCYTLHVSQVRVRVKDGGTPFKSATLTVKVNIDRNFKDPAWDQTSYTKSVSESVIVGTSVIAVTARDTDREVGQCGIILLASSIR